MHKIMSILYPFIMLFLCTQQITWPDINMGKGVRRDLIKFICYNFYLCGYSISMLFYQWNLYFWSLSLSSTGEVMWYVNESCPICWIPEYKHIDYCTKVQPFNQYIHFYSLKGHGNRLERNSLLQGVQNHR